MHRTEPPGDGGGEAGPQINLTAQVGTLLSLFRVTVDPGIAFPVCAGDGLFSSREQMLKRDGGCSFVRLLVLAFFITIPATSLVGRLVVLQVLSRRFVIIICD